MRGIWGLALALLAAAVAFGPARAAAPLAAYGDLPTIEQIAISPSGRLLAVAMVKNDQRTIVIEDLDAKKPVNGVRLGEAKAARARVGRRQPPDLRHLVHRRGGRLCDGHDRMVRRHRLQPCCPQTGRC